jgi:hypothetical protein
VLNSVIFRGPQPYPSQKESLVGRSTRSSFCTLNARRVLHQAARSGLDPAQRRALRTRRHAREGPKNRARPAVECEHGFSAAITVVLADNRVGLGASPSTDRHRISAGRKRVPEEAVTGKRIRFTDAERALLARKAKAVGRKAPLELGTIVSPATLLWWHRHLVAEKWNFAERRSAGRPDIMRHISELIVRMAELIVRMAQDNPSWGYTRI